MNVCINQFFYFINQLPDNDKLIKKITYDKCFNDNIINEIKCYMKQDNYDYFF